MRWLGLLALAVSSAALQAEPSSPLSPAGNQILELVCAECHTRPGIGVPLLGDEAAWQPLRAKGLEALVANTIDGYGNMPALGTCGWCGEQDLRALISWMAGFPREPEASAP